MQCPTENCEGTVEANPSLYLTIHETGAVTVYAVGYEDMFLKCDDHEHVLDPLLHAEFYAAVRRSTGELESYLKQVSVS